MEEKKPKGFRLGEILVQKGYITWEQLEEVLSIQAQTGDVKEILTYKPKPAGKVFNLGEILVRHGWISWEQLSEALEIQRVSGRVLGQILIEKKYIHKKDLYRALAIQQGLTFVDFDKIKIPPDVINLIPKRIALDHRIMPLVKKGSQLLMAAADPKTVTLDPQVIADYEIHFALAVPEDIDRALQQYYGQG